LALFVIPANTGIHQVLTPLHQTLAGTLVTVFAVLTGNVKMDRRASR
jgi:hypothetical protein